MDACNLPDSYISPVPFFPGPTTPVKELKTGELYMRNPVTGIVRAPLSGTGTFFCIGDSVQYVCGAGSTRVGRVIGLAASEVHKGLVCRVRRYMTASDVRKRAGFRSGPAGEEGNEGASALWETMSRT